MSPTSPPGRHRRRHGRSHRRPPRPPARRRGRRSRPGPTSSTPSALARARCSSTRSAPGWRLTATWRPTSPRCAAGRWPAGGRATPCSCPRRSASASTRRPRSGRRFADALGDVNRAVADVADRVLLVVAGRVLPLDRPEGDADALALGFLTVLGGAAPPDRRAAAWFGVVGALVGAAVGAALVGRGRALAAAGGGRARGRRRRRPDRPAPPRRPGRQRRRPAAAGRPGAPAGDHGRRPTSAPSASPSWSSCSAPGWPRWRRWHPTCCWWPACGRRRGRRWRVDAGRGALRPAPGAWPAAFAGRAGWRRRRVTRPRRRSPWPLAAGRLGRRRHRAGRRRRRSPAWWPSAVRRLGGYTGDVLGAAGVVAETVGPARGGGPVVSPAPGRAAARAAGAGARPAWSASRRCPPLHPVAVLGRAHGRPRGPHLRRPARAGRGPRRGRRRRLRRRRGRAALGRRRRATWRSPAGRCRRRPDGGPRPSAAGDLDRARGLLPALVGPRPAALDEPAIARAVVESVAENTTDAVVAPPCGRCRGGAPGAARATGPPTRSTRWSATAPARYGRFGTAGARLDDALAWVPARATAVLVAARPAPAGRATWPAHRPRRRARPPVAQRRRGRGRVRRRPRPAPRRRREPLRRRGGASGRRSAAAARPRPPTSRAAVALSRDVTVAARRRPAPPLAGGRAGARRR